MTLAATPSRHSPGNPQVAALRAEQSDLTDPALLYAVQTLRQAADTAAFYAACDRIFPPFPRVTEVEGRWRVSRETVAPIEYAIRRVRAHGLDAEHIAAFGDALLPDGTVIVVCAAGLSADEIASLVYGRARLDVAALSMVAVRRGYHLPSTGAQARFAA